MDNIIKKISKGFNAMGYSGNNEEYEEFTNEIYDGDRVLYVDRRNHEKYKFEDDLDSEKDNENK